MKLAAICREEASVRHSELLARGTANFELVTGLWALVLALEPQFKSLHGSIQAQRVEKEATHESPAVTAVFKKLALVVSQVWSSSMIATFNSAIFVLAHSILDEAVTQYVQLCLDLAPENWEDSVDELRFSELVKGSKLKLKEVKLLGLEGLVRQHFIKYREGWTHEPIWKRIEFIHKVCKTADSVPPHLVGFRFDKMRLNELDKTRQAVIHRVVLTGEHQNIALEIDYFRTLFEYLSWKIACHFDLDANARVMEEATVSTLKPDGMQIEIMKEDGKRFVKVVFDKSGRRSHEE